ncbi:DUF5701 family protein, partial [Streptomyces cremeus]
MSYLVSFFLDSELERFVTVKELEAPDSSVYVVFDAERGEEFCFVMPLDAMVALEARGRTGLEREAGHPQYPVNAEKPRTMNGAGLSRIKTCS